MRHTLPLVLKIFVLNLVLFTGLILSSQTAYAARTIDSATLNGSNSVTVSPSTEVTASVTVTGTGGAVAADWKSTSWNISGLHCIDHSDHLSAGTNSESFAITAPPSDGTYSISFIAYSNDSCLQGASNTYTMTNSIIISSSSNSTNNESSPYTGPIRYPTVTLSRTNLNFSGNASLEQGVIDLVQYSLDNGSSWISANSTDGKFDEITESFNFTPQLTSGVNKYTIIARARSLAQVYTLPEKYASLSFNITPPLVTLDKISPNPTKNQTPIITGRATSSLTSISRVEISIDEGKTWLKAEITGGKFSLKLDKLEDGNYSIRARVFDSLGNQSESETQILIIDTIPPIIGGDMILVGSQLLTPDANGIISTVQGTDITLTASMKGGVTNAKIISGDEEFLMSPISGSNLWSANINLKAPGQHLMLVNSQDGAGNQTERELNGVLVEDSGNIYKKGSDEKISNALVQVYFFDTIRQAWVLWDSESYGQKNPQQVTNEGKYGFLVPSGKYYLEVKANGYKTARSQILDFGDNTILNYDFSLETKLILRFNLPILGKIEISIPTFGPPTTITVNPKPESTFQPKPQLESGSPAPRLVLPSYSGKVIDTSALHSKYVISFVSIWSIHSLEQISILNEVQKELQVDQSLFAVFLQETMGTTQVFMRRGEYNFTALIDKNGESTNNFPITTLPQHFFIDSRGKIQEIYTGVLSKEELLNRINQLQ